MKISQSSIRLKESLRTYLIVAGSPSVELACFFLKIPDVFDALAAGDQDGAAADIDSLAITIMDALVEHIQTRVTQCQQSLAADRAKGSLVVAAGNYLRESRTGRERAHQAAGKEGHELLLTLVREGLAVLRALTGADYPEV